MKKYTVLLLILTLAIQVYPSMAEVDDFEDGVLNSTLWTWGGTARAWAPDAGPHGDWQFSHSETDGYLAMRVNGPTSGNTFGAEAWVRTNYNFNDGGNYVLNFTWKAEIVDYHMNTYFIQITDGYIPPETYNHIHWPYDSVYPPERDKTVDLLWSYNNNDEIWQRGGWFSPTEMTNPYIPGVDPETWSIVIDGSGTAQLYNGPDASGSLIRSETLDTANPWYLRFMISDATSSGFPAGDMTMKIYDVTPEPATLLLFTLAGLFLRRRKS